jgi:hypothetical protein
MGLHGWKLALCLSFAVLALGCGDDEDSGNDAGGAASEACMQAGFTQTGCSCSSEQPLGVRTCGEDLVWQACRCPAPFVEMACNPGQDVQCNACRGEVTGRLITCPESGMFDCSCGGQSDGGGDGDGGSGDGGSTPSDASTQDDAG